MNTALMDIRPARLFNVRVALVIACMLGVFALLAATVAEARGGRGGGGGGMRGGGGGRMGYSSIGSANRAGTRPSAGNSSGNRNRADTQPSTRPGNVGSGDRGNGHLGSGDRINNDLPGSGDRFGNINNGNINIDVDPGYGQIRHPLAAGLVVGAAIGAAAGAYYPYYGYGYGYGYWGGYYGDCSYYGNCHYSIPADCPKIDTYAVPYYYCDGIYYQQQMQGDTVVYVVVDPSAVGKDAKLE